MNFTFQYPLEFEPKSNWNYSNSGYIIAGKILELVSKKSWDTYLNENIFLPLQMRHTGYKELFSEVSSVKGYVGVPGKQTEVHEMNLSWALSAGALYSTVDDLLKYAETYSNPTIISTSALEDMTTPFLANYGLGVFIEKKQNDALVSHEGRTPGFVSHIHHLKNRNMSFISLDNTDGQIASNIPTILYQLFAEGIATVSKPDRITLSADEQKEYLGKFSDGGLEIEIILDSGDLYLFPKKQKPYLMQAIEKNNFAIGFAAEEFLRDSENNITSFKHYRNGKVIIFKKINSPTSH